MGSAVSLARSNVAVSHIGHLACDEHFSVIIHTTNEDTWIGGIGMLIYSTYRKFLVPCTTY